MSNINDILYKAITNNSASAKNELGMCYFNGEGVEKNEQKAFGWFKQAADQGLSQGKYNLAICYKEGIGTKKDMKKAMKLFEQAFETGDSSIAVDIGDLYFNGDGVEKSGKKAIEWYEKAAERGNMNAAFTCANLYLNGGNGITKDRAKAEKYFREVAARGHAEAQEILAKEFKVVGDYTPQATKSRGSRVRPEEDNISESEIELNNLIGLQSVKNQIRKIKAFISKNKNKKLNLHMCFNGNPGTGKTMVARIIGKILHEAGVLPKDPKESFVETDRDGLVSKFVGQTAEKTHKVVEKAMGGVLFIDEAYSLCTGDQDNVGEEAIATLIKDMENHRGEFCVILAGYTDKMKDMIATNPGFKSRIQFNIDFPNYNRDELKAIFSRILKNNFDKPYTIKDDVMEECLDIIMSQADSREFANARTVRQLSEQLAMYQSMRDSTGWELTMEDVNAYKKEHGFDSKNRSADHIGGENDDPSVKLTRLGYKVDPKELKKAEEELESLIGLKSVKEDVKRLKSYIAKNKGQNINLHMAFTGGPGTGKTVVARLIGKILYHSGVITKPIMGETDRDGLVAVHVGETGKKTHAVVQKTMGGILFIDEAYNLVSGGNGSNDFGPEAVGALLKDMEDYKGEFCTILAGYTKEMENLFHVNPGFKSRIQFQIEFPDYSREELGLIAKKMLKSEREGKYNMSEETLSEFLNVMEYLKENDPDFANARTVRNTIEQLVMNQNVRTSNEEDNFEITIEDIETFKRHKGIVSGSKRKSNTQINSSNPNIKVYSSGYKPMPEEAAKAEADLDEMIGLTRIKTEIKKVKAFLLRNKGNKINIHMAFLGGPGTGKTQVARIMSRILFHSGILPSSTFIETDRDGLVGRYIGETGKKTHEVIELAMGGVLFIDEAYNLVTDSASGNDFGPEAVGALLKDMEDYKGEFCTILAGYTKDMQKLFKVNQGFSSRVKFKFEFPDYSRDELSQITKLMLKKQFNHEYTMTEKVLKKFLDVMEELKKKDDWANARTVRNTIEQLIMNQNFRTTGEKEDWSLAMEDIETFVADEGIDM